MNLKLLTILTLSLLAFVNGNVLAADAAAGPSPTELKLRDALRSTMLQLRDAQSQVVTLQAAQAESDKEKADLSAKVDALTAQIKTLGDQAASDKAASEATISSLKQNNADLVTHMVDTLSVQINALSKPGPDDKAVLDKAVTSMKSQNPDLSKQLDQYGTDIQLWTLGYKQYVQFSEKTEAERNKLAAQVIVLQRVVTDRETKNLELFKTGNEILERYEKFSLGDALAAKEPFVGVSRVKLQELVQDYKDKLTAQKTAIGQAPALVPQSSGPTVANSASPAKSANQ